MQIVAVADDGSTVTPREAQLMGLPFHQGWAGYAIPPLRQIFPTYHDAVRFTHVLPFNRRR